MDRRKILSRLHMTLPAGLAVLLIAAAGLFAQDEVPEGGAPPEGTPSGEKFWARQVTRGPLHEAYASPLPLHGPRRILNHIPPAPAEEPIPAFRPQGEPSWIPGYWFFDDETQCFVWVGGIWRYAPEGRQWVPGFWKVKNGGAVWYPGFWAQPQIEDRVLAPPPPPRDPAVPTLPPEKDRVAYPGHWSWNGFQYFWQPGTWSRIGTGFVWVPPYNAPLPGGSRFVAGYWDYAFATRGLASCPSRVPPVVLKGKKAPKIVIEPVWFVRPEMVQPHLFVQNQSGHYLFGDYYSPLFQRLGIQHWFDSSRLTLDPMFSLERALHRDDKTWEVQVYKYVVARQIGQDPRPSREIVMSETGEIPQTSLAAPAELALSEMKLKGKMLADAEARAAIERRAVFMAMTREREQRDEFHPTKTTLAGNLPQISFDSTKGNLANSPLPGAGAVATKPQGLTPQPFHPAKSGPIYSREQVFAKLADITKQAGPNQKQGQNPGQNQSQKIGQSNSPNPNPDQSLSPKSDPPQANNPAAGNQRVIVPRGSADPVLSPPPR